MNADDRTVAVVITTYNHARYLGEAIESVKAQTVRVDEIIVVDDGSTDDPASVVAHHPDVRLIRQPNKGLAAARNTGLHSATSTFIAFLDADDRLLPTMVEVNLGQFDRRPECAFVYGAYVYIDASGHRISEVPLRAPSTDAYGSFLSGNLVGMHATVLYRRLRLLEESGFDVRLRAVEDYDLYLRLARNHPVVAQGDHLAEYRRHGANMSNNLPWMLSTALAVHERHRKAAARRPEWQQAFMEGKRNWKEFYADEQHKQLVRARTPLEVTRSMSATLKMAGLAPSSLGRRFLARFRRRLRQPLRRGVKFGDLRRTSPISKHFGFDRGKPVDRRYIEAFLAANAGDVRGRVLEVGDSAYTRQFGGDRVIRADVFNRYEGHPETTFVGDLCDASDLPSDAFDCIILTQTLHLLFDMPGAIRTLWRVLKPGGVLLLTVPWVSSIDRGEWGDDWYWSITPNALKRLLSGPFPCGHVTVQSYGNVMSATAFIYGLAEHELRPAELDVHDARCPVVVAGRAVKPAAGL